MSADETLTVHERMAAALADLSYIPKGRTAGVKYEFRGIDALMNHLHPVLAAHGLFLAPRVLDDWQLNMIPGTNDRVQSQALFRVCVDVYGADGDCVTLGPGLAQSHDYGDKAVYQAQQNAVKYVLLEAFCIPTEEQDMDGRYADHVPVQQHAPGPVNDKPPPGKRIEAALAKAKVPAAAFTNYLGSEGYEQWSEVPPQTREAMADGIVDGVLLDDVRRFVEPAEVPS